MKVTNYLNYSTLKYLCFGFWIPAYMVIIYDTFKNQHAKYSIIFCGICTAWELFYGFMSFGKKEGDFVCKILNVIYVLLEFGIISGLMLFGNTGSQHWEVNTRVLAFTIVFACSIAFFKLCCGINSNNYNEKRHLTAWIIVCLIPFIMNIEYFEFPFWFVIFAGVGNFMGLGTWNKEFEDPFYQKVLRYLLVVQLFATIYFVGVTLMREYGISIGFQVFLP